MKRWMMLSCWERKSHALVYFLSVFFSHGGRRPTARLFFCLLQTQTAVAAAGSVKRIASCTGGIFPGKAYLTPGVRRGKTPPELR